MGLLGLLGEVWRWCAPRLWVVDDIAVIAAAGWRAVRTGDAESVGRQPAEAAAPLGLPHNASHERPAVRRGEAPRRGASPAASRSAQPFDAPSHASGEADDPFNG